MVRKLVGFGNKLCSKAVSDIKVKQNWAYSDMEAAGVKRCKASSESVVVPKIKFQDRIGERSNRLVDRVKC